MFDIKRLIEKIITSLILLLSFLVLTGIILSVLSQNFGVDNIDGQEYIKNSHFLLAIFGSIGIVSIMYFIITMFLRNIRPSRHKLNPQHRIMRRNDQLDYIDDMHYEVVDGRPDDFEDELPMEFIDEIPNHEKLNRFGSISKKESSNIKVPMRSKSLVQTMMLYRSGGLIRGNRTVKIKVSTDGLHYAHYFIPKNSIKSFEINRNVKSIPKTENEFSFSRLMLLGPLSFLIPQEGLGTANSASKKLSIDYVEDNEDYTLLLEGDSATKVHDSLREMKSKFT